MEIKLQADGLQQLRTRIEAIKARTTPDGMKPAFTRAGMVVLRAAKDHIKSGAGDQGAWAPNFTGTPLLFRSGRLINSLTLGGAQSLVEYGSGEIRVGTNVPYGRMMQEGTGIFGPTGQRIFPTTKKALAFNGIVVKSIKGSPQRRFLYIDDAQAEIIRGVFADYILSGVAPTDEAS